MRPAILLLLLCCSFTTDKTPEQRIRSFKEWYGVHHGELELTQTPGELSFVLRYLPGELVICRELLTSGTASTKQLKSLYARYDAYETYSFQIVSPDGSNDLLLSWSDDKAAYQEKQFYLIEAIRDDFLLLRNSDTLRPLHCHFENNYGTAPFITLQLTFEKAAKNTRIKRSQLIYNDRLFTSDTLVFDCLSFTQLQIPKIK